MNDFTKRLNAVIAELDLTDIEVARACKISIGTVHRWKAGESAPHPLGRESVFQALQEARKPKR